MIQTVQGKGRKRRNRDNTTSPRRIAQQQLAQKAIELRKAGMTYEKIAEATGYSCAASARNAVARYLEISITEAGQELIQLETMRLDTMLMAIWNEVRKGHLGAVDRALKIMERRSKLLGLDRPTKFEGEVAGSGGLLVIPSPCSMDEWSKMASQYAAPEKPISVSEALAG